MAIFFTADTHFGHAAARALYRRPFPSVAANYEAMVVRWNEAVGPDDVVWHLGDFVAGPGGQSPPSRRSPPRCSRGSNGRKHLIIGNNDPPSVAALPGWSSAACALRRVGGGRHGRGALPLRLPHVAQFGGRGWVNLHGHSHGRLRPPLPRQADVGVDAQGFHPVALAQALDARRRRRPG